MFHTKNIYMKKIKHIIHEPFQPNTPEIYVCSKAKKKITTPRNTYIAYRLRESEM